MLGLQPQPPGPNVCRSYGEIGGSETQGALKLAGRQLGARPEGVRAALRSLGIPRQSSGPWG